jgi:hypothetical protein
MLKQAECLNLALCNTNIAIIVRSQNLSIRNSSSVCCMISSRPNRQVLQLVYLFNIQILQQHERLKISNCRISISHYNANIHYLL